jgi:hypothetical protein
VTEKGYGKFLLIYFGYGYCPDVYPTELANMTAMDLLGTKANRSRRCSSPSIRNATRPGSLPTTSPAFILAGR